MRFNQEAEVIYQIFPDRFARGGEQDPDPQRYPPQSRFSSWTDKPDRMSRGKQFFGGNLRGVIDKLPWLQKLGATAIMLTPIFTAPSYHKYDAIDFRGIDPGLGTEEDFEALVSAAHACGIKLIMDIAVNHLSANHPLFKKAQADPSCPERSMFRFSPDGKNYDCWWGYPGMPEINYDDPAARAEFIQGPGSVIAYWARRGIDGIRLDCANDLSPGVVRIIRETARAENPDIYVMGEIFSYPAEWLSSLDGVMNYSYRAAFEALVAGKIDSKAYGAFLSHFAADAGVAGLSDSLSMLSSHDTPRALYQMKGDRRLLEIAQLLQFTLPGIPMIYYGEEVGMDGGPDPDNRAPMAWDKARQDAKILERYRRLIALRAERAELLRGEIVDLTPFLPLGVIGFLRRKPADPGAFSFLLANLSSEARKFTLLIPESHCYSNLLLADAFSDFSVKTGVGAADFELEPLQYRYMLPRPRDSFPNYSFYKNRSSEAVYAGD